MENREVWSRAASKRDLRCVGRSGGGGVSAMGLVVERDEAAVWWTLQGAARRNASLGATRRDCGAHVTTREACDQ